MSASSLGVMPTRTIPCGDPLIPMPGGRYCGKWEFIVSTRLGVCNRGHEPTFVVANRREVLDITLASVGMSEAITDWRVEVVLSLSDHRTIRFTLMEVTVKGGGFGEADDLPPHFLLLAIVANGYWLWQGFD